MPGPGRGTPEKHKKGQDVSGATGVLITDACITTVSTTQ